jgi:hypothetical protein
MYKARRVSVRLLRILFEQRQYVTVKTREGGQMTAWQADGGSSKPSRVNACVNGSVWRHHGRRRRRSPKSGILWPSLVVSLSASAATSNEHISSRRRRGRHASISAGDEISYQRRRRSVSLIYLQYRDGVLFELETSSTSHGACRPDSEKRCHCA